MKYIFNSDKPFQTPDPLGNNLFFLLGLCLLVLPIWVVSYPPMVDIPQHMAQINTLKHFWSGDEYFRRIYQLNWFTPYLVGYLSIYLLSLFLPLLISLKLLLSLSLIGLALVVRRLFQVVEIDPSVVWLTFPAAIGYSFYFGFLNFFVTTPIAIYFIICGIEFEKFPTFRKTLALVLLSMLLFFCHVLALAYSLLILGAVVLVKNHRNIRLLFLKLLPLTFSMLLGTVWLLITHHGESQASNSVIVYDITFRRVLVLLQTISGSDLPAPMWIISAVVLLYPPLSGARLTRKTWRWVPLAVSLVVFSIIPMNVFGTGFVYPRFGQFVGIFWLLIWDYKSVSSKYLRWVVFICIIGWFGFNTTRFWLFEQENDDFKTVLSHMEPNKRTLSLMADNRTPYFNFPMYLHYGAWYQAENRGIVDFSFSMFFPLMLRYKKDSAPKIYPGFEWNPIFFDWKQDNGSNYYYFLVRAPVNIGRQVFKGYMHKVRLKANIGNWWLYENAGNIQ